MKILIYDHAGHPFQAQLSRELAKRGHKVLHTYCSKLQTPRGALLLKGSDPVVFNVRGVSIGQTFSRHSLFTRFLQEGKLGRRLVDLIDQFCPDNVVSANTPLGTQTTLLRKCRKKNIGFVFWVQDLLGVGIKNNVRKKLPILGDVIGWFYILLEELLLKKSDEIVVITEDFCPIMNKAGIPNNKVHVIHNWAPLEEIYTLPKSNPWSKKYRLDQKFCFLYSGTLGMKHNPDILLKLALRFQAHPDVRLVVITEGMGADYLKEKKLEHSLENLVLMPFQSFENLPMVLASADVLLAILKPDAGVFAVPSKVLTYLCAERPLLLAVPFENLAARIVKENEAGICVGPNDIDGFIKSSETFIHDYKLRERLGKNARKYAENTFDIENITDKFEGIFYNLLLLKKGVQN
jgi:glycosyltransferase involved in cell wall biosynthesis